MGAAMHSDWDRIEDDWHAYKELAAEKWTRIDRTTLEATRGRRDALVEAIERAYDISREQARREVTWWQKSAPQERAARADRPRPPGARQGQGRRRFGQRRPEIDPRPPADGWWAGAQDMAGQAMRHPLAQARAHPVGAMLLALGLGSIIVQAFARR